jgi:hypothetical protein
MVVVTTTTQGEEIARIVGMVKSVKTEGKEAR